MKPLLDHLAPMLSTLVDYPPTADDWLHEIKYDGYRLLCRKDGDDIRFFTRNGHNWTEKFPGLVEAVRGMLVNRLWMDGELVVMLPDGMSCFGSLQEALHRRDRTCLAFYAFDLLHLDSESLIDTSLINRKGLLREIIPPLWNLKFVDSIRGHGDGFFRQACALGLEGIISKRTTSLYRPGARSNEWVKVKCTQYVEVRTGSWDHRGSRKLL
jgi:bifunctional non-homologous end joining protein LigD